MCRSILVALLASSLLVACGEATDTPDDESANGKSDEFTQSSKLDQALRASMQQAGVVDIDPGEVAPADDPKVVLGQNLFFDKILSGNEDVACATCHHPLFGTGDGLTLPVGVGGDGLGPLRTPGEGREMIPRNSPEIFNRGATAWTTMFWDNRVSGDEQNFYSPAGDELPDDLDSVLAVQAMFPVTSGDEMRGQPGENEIADAETLTQVWERLMDRLLEYEEYEKLFAAAYPDKTPDELGFEHAANAIAAFEVSAFTTIDSPYDRYVAGDDDALTFTQKRGAVLFFGDANCSSCHNGALLTDQLTHVVAVPQVGPGKGDDAPLDIGRMLETGEDEDKFAFRTPPLRNVGVTGPYMHSGVYTTLRQVIDHHFDPRGAMERYDATLLAGEIDVSLLENEAFVDECLSRVSDELTPKRPLSEDEIFALIEFLHAMTDPRAVEMTDVVPSKVPSRLPVDDGTDL